MSKPNAVDDAALNLMLSELRLPSIKSLWPRSLTEQAAPPSLLVQYFFDGFNIILDSKH